MNSICRQIRQRAAEEGVEQIRQRVDQTPAVAAHVADCIGCQRALDALAALDTALAELPPIDASDEAVAALLACVVAEAEPTGAAANGSARRGRFAKRLVERFGRLRGWLTTPTTLRPLAMASVALVALSVALWIPSLHQAPRTDVALSTVNVRLAEAAADEARVSLDSLGYVGSSSDGSSSQEVVSQLLRRKREHISGKKRELQERLSLLEHKDGSRSNAATALSGRADVTPEPSTPAAQEVPKPPARQLPMPRSPASTPPTEAARKQVEKIKKDVDVTDELEEQPVSGMGLAEHEVLFDAPSSDSDANAFKVDGVNITDMKAVGASPTYFDFDNIDRMAKSASQPAVSASPDAGLDPKPGIPRPVVKSKAREQKKREEQAQGIGGFHANVEADNSRIEEMRLEARRLEKGLAALEGGGASGSAFTPKKSIASQATVAAAAFLAERERVAPLTFQPATGYWANTYLPGDPARRFLEARLAERGLDALRPYHQQSLRLHDASRQPTQPFDPPRSAALALYVDMDRHGAAGPARTLVQVGLRATDRHSGHRVPLTLAVVIDLAENLSGNQVEHVRALLRALLATVESGDRVHLLFAGRDVSMLPSASFRHGAVMVALEEALAAPKIIAQHDLADRLALAREQLLAATADDGDTASGEPSAALGATGALIVSARAGLPAGLELASHRSALAGVPVSVVALGTKVDRASYARVALAGQGGLRHLIAAADAEDLIDRELASLGRVVARALRLNIRLAPGVQLIDVIGSHRLDLAATARARAAEHSIDQMAQRDLGIRADRGEDDDGIQILIPAFYAGDAHVVLLDVVVRGPGKVADVSVRYKDLVRSKNGSAHARLKLGRAKMRRPAAGDRGIRGVRKSLLAAKLQTDLEAAAEALAQGRPADATQRLSALRDLLTGLGTVDSGWASDRDITNDLAVLHEYLAVLDAGAAGDAQTRDLLADSLRLAAARKILRLADLGIDSDPTSGDPQSSDTKPGDPVDPNS